MEYESYSPTKRILFTGFKITVVAISALTSFLFFATFLPSLTDPILGGREGQLLTGLLGVLLLDGACLMWLHLRSTADTGQQGGLALIGAALTFIGSAMASISYLALSASNVQLSADSTGAIEVIALVGVIAAVIVNFGLVIVYEQQSLENQKKQRNIERQHKVIDTEAQQERHLDLQMKQHMLSLLEEMAPEMSEQAAIHFADAFQTKERQRYGLRPTVAPNGHRKRVPSVNNGE